MLNVHTTPNITSRRVLVTLLVCYRLPLLILCSSWIMILCYNAFFLSVVKQEVFSDASSSFSVNVRRLTMLCLTVEDVLFALLYWSFFRAVFTAPDTIDATVWAHPPQANKMQQKWDEVIWSRQQGWFEEQRREREAAAQYQRQQLKRLLEEPPSVEVEVTEEKPSPPAPNPSSSSGGLSSRGGEQHQSPKAEEESCNRNTVSEYEANGNLRFCRVCDIYKPDRSHHCRLCGRCTPYMDHHCVYLNNCISNRNYKYFFLLLAYSTVCGVLGVVSLCVVLFGLFPAEALWRRKSWFLEVLAFFLYVLFVAYLLQYHVMLLWSGRTTIAHLGDKTRETFMIQQGFPHKSSVRDRCAAHFTGDSLLLVEGGARRGGSRQARWREVFGVGGPVWYHLLPLSPRRSEGGSKAQST